MTNNLEDFEQPDLESGGEGTPPTGIKANLSHAWRTRPLFKLLVLMIVAAAIIAVSINLFSSKPQGEQTKLQAPPLGLKQPPGGPASPYFNDQQRKAEEERTQTALKTGGSALPTPIGENKSIDEMTDNERQKKDPLVELRNQIDHQKQEIAQMKQQQQQGPAAAPAKAEQFDDSLAQAMQKELQKLMIQWEPKGITQVVVTKDDDQGKKSSETGNADAAAARAAAANQQQQKVIVPAGTVSYAQLLTEANSDVPGPILAQVVSGPLSGARVIGEFKVTTDPYLIMRFSLANLKGKDYGIDALALDPDTTLGGMATEVDERWVTRVLLPAAAGFIQGFGSALGQGSSSIVSNGTTTIVQQSGKGLQQGMFQGLAQAGQTAGQFFENQANQTKPLVRVAAGTPMGLFFLSSVVDRGNGNVGPAYPVGMPGMPGFGGPGNGNGNSGYGGYGGYGQSQMPGNYYPGMSMSGSMGGYNSQYSPGMNSGQSYSNSNLPYPNTATPYDGNALTNPNATISPYYGNTSGTYGIGTPLVNP